MIQATCPNCGQPVHYWAELNAYHCTWCGQDVHYTPVVIQHQEVAQVHRKFEAIVNREWADSPTRWGKVND